MVVFRCQKYKDRVPYVTDAAIDDFAERVVADYNAKMLRDVVPIDYITFLDSYLRLNLSFADIFFEDGGDPILGATSFNDGDKLKVFDKENSRTKKIALNRGSVLLDGSLNGDNMLPRQLFTALHECGHWMLHQQYYSREYADEYDFDVACCRSSEIEPRGKKQLVTAHDFLEHQANMFASAIAMPRRIVRRIAPTVFGDVGIGSKNVNPMTGTPSVIVGLEQGDTYLQDEIADEFATLFGVSKRAAKIRLQKLELVVDVSENIVG